MTACDGAGRREGEGVAHLGADEVERGVQTLGAALPQVLGEQDPFPFLARRFCPSTKKQQTTALRALGDTARSAAHGPPPAAAGPGLAGPAAHHDLSGEAPPPHQGPALSLT